VPAKEISHVLIETSRGITLLSGTTTTGREGPSTFGAQGNSNPGIPGDLFGLKFDLSGLAVSWQIETDRAPMWGDFYAKNGKHRGQDVYAYNVHFGAAAPALIRDAIAHYERAVALGDEVQGLLKLALQSRTMHLRPMPGKSSGAYQTSVYGQLPFVFLNHRDTYDSLTTYAHEWGHGLDDRYGGISQINGLSEGWGDILGLYLADSPILGSGFQTAGVALRRGHPVYFVIFFRDPEPGQTILDVTAAEGEFLRHIRARHPRLELDSRRLPPVPNQSRAADLPRLRLLADADFPQPAAVRRRAGRGRRA